MSYISQSLIFEEDKIHFTNSNGEEEQVMMDWEHEIMSGSASYITQNGGDILEIGFGMGISAGYIQSQSINSHTICEIHPDIIPKALEWAEDKPNVTIITGSWYDNLDILSKYDGVFYDTYGDNHSPHFLTTLPQLMNVGGLATWWNPSTLIDSNFGDIEYQEFTISPPENSYLNLKSYFLPKMKF
jgi:predicted O-methyltransferase YrrM